MCRRSDGECDEQRERAQRARSQAGFAEGEGATTSVALSISDSVWLHSDSARAG